VRFLFLLLRLLLRFLLLSLLLLLLLLRLLHVRLPLPLRTDSQRRGAAFRSRRWGG